MKRCLLLVLASLLSGCATPIVSTVDGYGEMPLSPSDALFFDREALPLAEKPIADSCRDAAKDAKLYISDQLCPNCKRVEVRSRLAGTSQAVNGSPGFGSSVGIMGGNTAFGIGYGGGSTSSHAETERIIDISIFEGSKALRTITTRSVGRDNSVSAVAYEMCAAAFQDYPSNLTGKVYRVKPRDKDD